MVVLTKSDLLSTEELAKSILVFKNDLSRFLNKGQNNETTKPIDAEISEERFPNIFVIQYPMLTLFTLIVGQYLKTIR